MRTTIFNAAISVILYSSVFLFLVFLIDKPTAISLVSTFPTWLAQLAASVTWPIVTLLIVFSAFYNKEKFAEIIKTIKFGDLEVVLRENVKEASEIAAEIENTSPTLITKKEIIPEDERNVILQLAEIDPASAIVKCWKKLESKIQEVRQFHGLVRFTNPIRFMQLLYRRERITHQEYELYNRLRTVRNQAAHMYHTDSGISDVEVQEYLNSVETLVQRLEHARREPYVGLDHE